MSHPAVSVVVPVRNGAATIAGTLLALANQTGAPPGTEILVVDNGSSDGTPDVVRRFTGVALLMEPRPGPSAARNRGLRSARGEIIAYLDADTRPSRRWLTEIVAPFADPAVVLVGGRTLSYPPTTPAERYTAACGRFEPENNVYRDVFPFAPSQNLAVRREAALAAGGWAEEMRSGEDIDFCHRVLKSHPGQRIVYRPTATLLHQERSTDAALRDQAWLYGEGAALMYRRYPEKVHWDVAKTLHLARVLMSRGLAPVWLGAAAACGWVPRERLEFAVYHRLWTWWWWRGFFSMYLRGEPRARG